MSNKNLDALMGITEAALDKRKPLSDRGMVFIKNKNGNLTAILPTKMKSNGMLKCIDKNREAIDEFKDDDNTKILKL